MTREPTSLLSQLPTPRQISERIVAIRREERLLVKLLRLAINSEVPRTASDSDISCVTSRGRPCP
jgi:hypothetical protein